MKTVCLGSGVSAFSTGDLIDCVTVTKVVLVGDSRFSVGDVEIRRVGTGCWGMAVWLVLKSDAATTEDRVAEVLHV